MPNFPKVRPTHFTLRRDGKWIDWPFGEISVTALKKHELGKPKTIQGIAVFSMYGGLVSANTFWRWDSDNGFTEGEHANVSATK